MRDGSFTPDLHGVEFEEDFEIKNTALPSQVPERISLSQLPETIGKSGVIEAIMSQNEDLMSRLGVALRRIAQLEDKMAATQSENLTLKDKHESLQDQVLVFKEKARLLAARKNEGQESVQELKEQLKLLEIRYSEVYQTLQTKEARWLSRSEQTESETLRLRRYRQRMQKVAKGLQARYKEIFASHKTLSQKFSDRETLFETVRNNLLQANEHIQTQKQEFETELQRKEMVILKLTEDFAALQKAKDTAEATAEDSSAKAIELENELVLKDRRYDEFQMSTAKEISDLQSALVRYRNEAKDLALELESKIEEVREKDTHQVELRKQNFNLQEQVENLQALWKEQQRKLEKLVEKNTSLQKLNQELSIAINQHRRDLRDARERLDANQMERTEAAETTTVEKRPELLDKIDKALGHLL